MHIFESYLAACRDAIASWAAAACDATCLPILQMLYQSRLLLIGLGALVFPTQDATPGSAILLADSKNRFAASKFGKHTLAIAESVEPFAHQVAGHTREVMVRYRDIVLKPKLKEKSFLNEISFYEAVFSAAAYGAFFPQRFVPNYHGTLMLPTASEGLQPFIALDDVTKGMWRPSIIDIKMGQKTHEPGAALSKIERSRAKYPFQEEIGFRLTGMKIYDSKSQSYFSTDKSFGRSLRPDDVVFGLLPFFYDGHNFRREIISIVIEKLELLLRWFKSQNHYLFFCSSLLIVYEGSSRQYASGAESARDGLHFMTLAAQRAHAIGASSRSSSDQQNCQTQMDRSKWIDRDQQDSCWNDDLITEKRSVSERIVFRSCSNVQIRMIDFAHTLPSEQGIPDAGYIYGLSSLLRSLKKAQNIIDIEFANDILENVGSILQRNSENK